MRSLIAVRFAARASPTPSRSRTASLRASCVSRAAGRGDVVTVPELSPCGRPVPTAGTLGGAAPRVTGRVAAGPVHPTCGRRSVRVPLVDEWPRLEVHEVGDAKVAELMGGVIASERDATEVLGNASYLGADHVLVTAEQLGPGFRDLSSGLAGAVAQKFVNYGMRLVVVGVDPGAGSESWRAWVRESNRGSPLWFLAGRGEARAGLARGGGAAVGERGGRPASRAAQLAWRRGSLASASVDVERLQVAQPDVARVEVGPHPCEVRGVGRVHAQVG